MTDFADRATVEEKAEAWDKVMEATGDQAIALTAARRWLRDTVDASEAAQRFANDADLAVEAENAAQFRFVRDVVGEDSR